MQFAERADPQAGGQRGAAEGAGGRRLPQRPAYLGRLLRHRRRQDASSLHGARREAAADHGPRECRRGGGGRPDAQAASRSATSGWSIPGSAAAPARCASAATSSSAWRRASSASIRDGGYASDICWCRIRAICCRLGKHDAGAGGAARLLGRHRLWRAEEARPAWSSASRW